MVAADGHAPLDVEALKPLDLTRCAARELAHCVTVAYSAGAGQVTLKTLTWRPGLQVAAAVQSSGIMVLHPELDLTTVALGVWGRRVQQLDAVHAGDRIELYRPLRVDPKEARRVRDRAQRPKRKPLQPRRPRPDAADHRRVLETAKARTPST